MGSLRVSLAECRGYGREEVERALKAALEPLGGLEWVRPGMRIAVKANLVSAMKPDAAATTHPAVLCALTEQLKARGAEVILGDSPGGLYTRAYVEHVYSATGMRQVEAAGARLNRDFSVKEGVYGEARAAKSFTYTGWLDQADAIISVSKLKTHGMMSMSAAAKNLFGAIPGTVKPEYHYRFPNPADFANMIVDLNEYFRPRLSLIDAVVGMEGNGPTAGEPRPIGLLLASESPHAADLLAAALLGLKPGEVPTLAAAQERGLIPSGPEQLEVSGPAWQPWVMEDYNRVGTVRSLRFSRDSTGIFGRATAGLIDKALASRPKLLAAECVGCGECARLCPAKAIVMENHRPRINRAACIRCFCCQEFCPKGAMKVHRTPLARMLAHG